MLPEAGKTGSFQRFYKKSDIICIMTHSLTSSDIKQFQSYLMDSNVKLNTVKKFVRDVKKLAHFLSDQTQTLSQNSLDAFLKSLPEAGYEARSINSIIASIKSYCKFAGRTDLQCKSLNIRKKSNHEDIQNRLTEEEYEALLRTALEQKNYRQVLMIQIFAVTDKVYPQNLKRQLVRSHFSVTYP